LDPQEGHILLSPSADRRGLRQSLADAGLRVNVCDTSAASASELPSPPVVVVLDAADVPPSKSAAAECLTRLLANPLAEGILLLGNTPFPDGVEDLRPLLLPFGPTESMDALAQVVFRSLDYIATKQHTQELEDELARRSRDLRELNDIGVALSAERDLDTLLDMVLLKSREITSADAGSLYLIEPRGSEKSKHLLFRLSQNDSLDVSYDEFTMPMDEKSIAGYVALKGVTLNIGDVYEIEAGVPYGFNKTFDETFNYVSKSMLTVPMKNTRGDVLGVIQLLNCKRDFSVKLTGEPVVDATVIPFDDNSEDLVSSLASQAAVALENSYLYQDIENLFECFVRASVSAIESRDPPTSGHSERVAILTVSLAEATEQTEVGRYRNLFFTPQQLKELRYASLLHDFGKVGVRENVLVKPKKLPDGHLDLVRKRFEFIQRTTQYAHSRRDIEFLLERNRDEYMQWHHDASAETVAALKELDDCLMEVLLANEPSVLPTEISGSLKDIAQRTYEDMRGIFRPFLDAWEVNVLSIPKGSLDERERKEIESHVSQSFQFLRQIPWTWGLESIPQIAYAHHEKLDGSGYPRGLTSDEIPVQAKMMTISDIFDALTSADRPYKKKVPVPKALDILRSEADEGQLDKELLGIFIERRVFEQVAEWGK